MDLLGLILEGVGVVNRLNGGGNKVQKTAEKYGSRDYVWTVPATVAGATFYIWVDTQFPDSMNYAPLDYLEIVNNDTVNVTVILNGGDVVSCPAGVIRKKADGVGIRSVAVRNDDAAIASTLGLIVCTLKKRRKDINDLAVSLAW